MKRIRILLFCFSICCLHNTGNAQEDEKIFDFVEQMPSFPGGQDSLYSFIGRNIRYPALARENNISGSVVLKFYIDTEGYIRNLSVIKSVHPSLDAEAMRVVQLMNDQGKRWTPGMNEVKSVPVQFALPIKFILQSEKDSKKKSKRS